MNCPTCNNQIQPGAAFCDNCGTPISSIPAMPPGPVAAPVAGGGIVCPQCRTPAMPGEAFCGNCGASLAQAAVAPATPVYTPSAAPVASFSGGGGANVCAQCRTPLQPGSMFCDSCGAPVSSGAAPQQPPQSWPSQQPAQPIQQSWAQPQQPPQQWPPQPPVSSPPSWPPQQVPPQQTWTPGPTITPRLVVQATGAPLSFPMGKSEIFIGREDPVSNHFPDVNLGPHGGEEGGVSRNHAKLIIQGNQCFLEDLKAVNYTFVNRQRLNEGARQPLNNGDELRFGKIIVMFYTQ
jgi:pSer/pThr/pTyr-binding forkhead associated (FHA) protein